MSGADRLRQPAGLPQVDPRPADLRPVDPQADPGPRVPRPALEVPAARAVSTASVGRAVTVEPAEWELVVAGAAYPVSDTARLRSRELRLHARSAVHARALSSAWALKAPRAG